MTTVLETGSAYLTGDDASITNAALSTSVSFSRIYDNPVVVAYIATNGGGQDIDARITNLTGSGGDIFIHEPDHEGHNYETVVYMVAEEGVHETPEGHRIEAGVHQTKTSFEDGDSFNGNRVSFLNDWSTAPVVFATPNTHNNAEWATTGLENVSAGGFDVAQQRGGHQSTVNSVAIEELGWIAVENVGASTLDGAQFEVGTTTSTSKTWASPFSLEPDVLVESQTRAGTSSGWSRGYGITTTDHNWQFESSGSGQTHGYLAVDPDVLVDGYDVGSHQDGTFYYNTSTDADTAAYGYDGLDANGNPKGGGGTYAGVATTEGSVYDQPPAEPASATPETSTGSGTTTATGSASATGIDVTATATTTTDVVASPAHAGGTRLSAAPSTASTSIVTSGGALAGVKRGSATNSTSASASENKFFNAGNFQGDTEILGNHDGFQYVGYADATTNSGFEDIFTGQFNTTDFPDFSGPNQYVYLAFAAKWTHIPNWGHRGTWLKKPPADPDNYQIYVLRNDGQNSRDEYFRVYYPWDDNGSSNMDGVGYIADPYVWLGRDGAPTDAQITGTSGDRTVEPTFRPPSATTSTFGGETTATTGVGATASASVATSAAVGTATTTNGGLVAASTAPIGGVGTATTASGGVSDAGSATVSATAGTSTNGSGLLASAGGDTRTAGGTTSVSGGGMTGTAGTPVTPVAIREILSPASVSSATTAGQSGVATTSQTANCTPTTSTTGTRTPTTSATVVSGRPVVSALPADSGGVTATESVGEKPAIGAASLPASATTMVVGGGIGGATGSGVVGVGVNSVSGGGLPETAATTPTISGPVTGATAGSVRASVTGTTQDPRTILTAVSSPTSAETSPVVATATTDATGNGVVEGGHATTINLDPATGTTVTTVADGAYATAVTPSPTTTVAGRGTPSTATATTTGDGVAATSGSATTPTASGGTVAGSGLTEARGGGTASIGSSPTTATATTTVASSATTTVSATTTGGGVGATSTTTTGGPTATLMAPQSASATTISGGVGAPTPTTTSTSGGGSAATTSAATRPGAAVTTTAPTMALTAVATTAPATADPVSAGGTPVAIGGTVTVTDTAPKTASAITTVVVSGTPEAATGSGVVGTPATTVTAPGTTTPAGGSGTTPSVFRASSGGSVTPTAGTPVGATADTLTRTNDVQAASAATAFGASGVTATAALGSADNVLTQPSVGSGGTSVTARGVVETFDSLGQQRLDPTTATTGASVTATASATSASATTETAASGGSTVSASVESAPAFHFIGWRRTGLVVDRDDVVSSGSPVAVIIESSKNAAIINDSENDATTNDSKTTVTLND